VRHIEHLARFKNGFCPTVKTGSHASFGSAHHPIRVALGFLNHRVFNHSVREGLVALGTSNNPAWHRKPLDVPLLDITRAISAQSGEKSSLLFLRFFDDFEESAYLDQKQNPILMVGSTLKLLKQLFTFGKSLFELVAHP
jgi:hypothetical protein